MSSHYHGQVFFCFFFLNPPMTQPSQTADVHQSERTMCIINVRTRPGNLGRICTGSKKKKKKEWMHRVRWWFMKKCRARAEMIINTVMRPTPWLVGDGCVHPTLGAGTSMVWYTQCLLMETYINATIGKRCRNKAELLSGHMRVFLFFFFYETSR